MRVAVTGAGENGVFRRREWRRRWEDVRCVGVGGDQVSADGLMSDIHASAEYRANLVKVMAKRAVAKAAG